MLRLPLIQAKFIGIRPRLSSILKNLDLIPFGKSDMSEFKHFSAPKNEHKDE